MPLQFLGGNISCTKTQIKHTSTKVFTVSHPKVVQQPNKSQNDFTFCRGVVEAQTKYDYSGTLFTNTFKVNQSIVLLGVSFFGPHDKYEKEAATYSVTLGLKHSGIFGNSRKVLLELTSKTVEAKRGEKFRVNLPQMVILKPDIWYDIQFELNGPQTGHIRLGDVKTNTFVEIGKEKVILESFVGSRQMPDFHFLLN